MLPKAHRLTAKDIEGLSVGKSVFGTLISMRYRSSKESKLSVSVSKKTAPRAVDRNRLRRRVYAAFEGAKLSLTNPAFAMLMPKKECLTTPFPALKEEIVSLFVKARLVRG